MFFLFNYSRLLVVFSEIIQENEIINTAENETTENVLQISKDTETISDTTTPDNEIKGVKLKETDIKNIEPVTANIKNVSTGEIDLVSLKFIKKKVNEVADTEQLNAFSLLETVSTNSGING